MALLGTVCAVSSVACATSRQPSAVSPAAPLPICSFQYSSDVTIHCVVDGQFGPPLVFLHGFGTSSETWQDIRPLLNQHGSLYLVDLKGFGLSSKPRDSNYTPDEQANIVAALIRHHNLRDCVLVGHSYGGGIALLAYRKLKAQGGPMPKGLVLIDPAVYPQRLPSYIAVLRRPMVNRLIFLFTSSSFRARYTLNRVFYNKGAITPERVARYTRFLDVPGARHSFVAAARQIDKSDPDDVSAHLAEVDGRTLVIWGAHDPVIAVSHGHRLRDELPHASLVLAPGSGHVPHEEEPEPVAAAILEFLRTLP